MAQRYTTGAGCPVQCLSLSLEALPRNETADYSAAYSAGDGAEFLPPVERLGPEAHRASLSPVGSYHPEGV